MLYFIVNPLSGKGKGKETAEEIKSVLNERKIEFEMFFTEYHTHAIKLAEELSKKDDCTGVVAVGGDGTFNEVLCGLDMRVPLGLITSGMGNDFMRTFAPNKTLLEQLEPIINGTTRCIDYIIANEKRCLNVAGTGFDVDILIRQARLRKVLGGSMSYLASLFITLLTLKFRHFVITVDDNRKIESDGVLIAASNGRFFGGGLPVSPKSCVDDGVLDFLIIKRMPRLKIPGVLSHFLKGTIGEVTKYAEVIKCRALEGTVSPRVKIQLDGELVDMEHFRFEICSNQLKVFA